MGKHLLSTFKHLLNYFSCGVILIWSITDKKKVDEKAHKCLILKEFALKLFYKVSNVNAFLNLPYSLQRLKEELKVITYSE